MIYAFLLAFGIGLVAGLRSLAAPAIVAWAAYLGLLNLHGSPLAFMESGVAVAVLSLLALGELIGDKLPRTPNRTALAPLLARIITGGLSGASLCAATHRSLAVGAILGAVGGVVGAFLGYSIRRRSVTSLRVKDLYLALGEDLLAIGAAIFLVTR